MKRIKYTLFTLALIASAAILYFPYHLKNRIQVSLTQNEDTVSALARELVIYDIPGLDLERMGKDYDGGYVVPPAALEKADILLGYGIGSENSFEDNFSLKYNKRSYGFDCGVRGIKGKSPLFKFIPHCLATADHILDNQTSSGQVSSFSQQISFLKIMDKDVFIKMDIEGSEYQAFDDILRHSGMITGMVFELHMFNEEMIEDAIKLLSKINDHFLLVHIHGNNGSRYYISGEHIKGQMPNMIELTYINKRLVRDYRIKKSQSYPTNHDMPNLAIREENKFQIIF